MKNSHENKLSMFLAVRKACEQNLAKINSQPALANAYQQFVDKISQIEAQSVDQGIVITGYTKTKQQKRLILIENVYQIASAAVVYASVNNNLVLFDLVQFSPSNLKRERDTYCIEKCTRILNAGIEHAAELVNYGITQAILDLVQNQIEELEQLIGETRLLISQRKEKTATLARLFSEVDGLLKLQMDRMVTIIQKDSPNFAEQYRSTRMIIDSGRKSTKIKGKVVDQKGVGIQFVSVELFTEGQPDVFTVQTDQDGNYEFAHLSPGNGELTFTKSGYESAGIEKSDIRRGKLLTINHTLNRIGRSPGDPRLLSS